LELLTQAAVEEQLQSLGQRLESATFELAELAEAEARAEVAFKREWATAYVHALGPQKERESKATMVADAEFEAYRLAEASYRATRELCVTLRAQLDALRTIAANIRVQT
jgi:hypothetical protein